QWANFHHLGRAQVYRGGYEPLQFGNPAEGQQARMAVEVDREGDNLARRLAATGHGLAQRLGVVHVVQQAKQVGRQRAAARRVGVECHQVLIGMHQNRSVGIKHHGFRTGSVRGDEFIDEGPQVNTGTYQAQSTLTVTYGNVEPDFQVAGQGGAVDVE